MIATTVALLIMCQHMSTTESTRLPLEVYELTPGASGRYVAASATTAVTSTAEMARQVSNNFNYNNLKHKNLEYSTINNKNKSTATVAASSSSSLSSLSSLSSSSGTMTGVTGIDDTGIGIIDVDGGAFNDADVVADDNNNNNADDDNDDGSDLSILDIDEHNIRRQQQEIDRRKSRQMLDDIIKHHHINNDINNNNNNKNNNYKNIYNKNNHENSNSGRKHNNEQDVRVLYQVGESEEDLPICAPNAICSKIDLYETPWIERQCRCPTDSINPHHLSTSTTGEHRVVHEHHTINNINPNDNKNINNNNENNKLYRSYYERDKFLQHRRLLSGIDMTDSKFDALHLKKLMQKLGAVYEEELQLQPNDYLHGDDNDAIPSTLQLPAEHEHEHGEHASSAEDAVPKRMPSHRLAALTHMRHGGHHYGSVAATTKPLVSARLGNCPSGLDINDGHTIADKTRHYKLCQPIHKLPVCKHFRDYTWTLKTSLEMNVTEQIVHCRCPRNSVTYLTKREAADNGLNGYIYYFACSPVTRLRCRRKQPCKLFTVRKRQEFLDEVNINALCQCPKGHSCPSRHTHSGVIAGESFLEDNIQTYSGYCMAND